MRSRLQAPLHSPRMQPRSGITESLHCCKLFKGLTDEQLDAVSRSFRRETWSRQSSLPPGRALQLFTVIVSGRMEVMRYHPETDRRLTVALLEPCEAFDVLTLMDGKMHDVITRAAEPVVSLTAPLPAVRRWVDQIPAFEHALLREVAQQMHAMEDLAAEIALFDTPTRLSNLILKYAEPDPGSPEGHPQYVLRGMSHDMIARMIGSVRAVVNRCLQEMKTGDAVQLRRHEIRINDLESILARADRLHEQHPSTPHQP